MLRKNLLKGFKRPKGITFEHSEVEPRYGRFVAYPFERGYGVTIGNTLRRILLSSIQGCAITAVKITAYQGRRLPAHDRERVRGDPRHGGGHPGLHQQPQAGAAQAGRGPRGEDHPARAEGQPHAVCEGPRGRQRPRDREPGLPDRHAHGQGEPRARGPDQPGARLRARRAQREVHRGDRYDSRRRPLLAGAQGQVRGGEHAGRPAYGLRQAGARDLDRRDDHPRRRPGRGREDRQGPLHDLHQLRRSRRPAATRTATRTRSACGPCSTPRWRSWSFRCARATACAMPTSGPSATSRARPRTRSPRPATSARRACRRSATSCRAGAWTSA